MRLKWHHSDQPYDSQFIDFPNWGARVRPIPNGGWEWSVWIGQHSRRVLHARVAAKKLVECDRRYSQSFANR